MTAFIYIAIIITGLVIIYLLIIRPWHLKWGATKEELMLELPGDNNVHKPNFNATRGITIHSTPELVWRWIIQIGSKRAGWYSIDWMDNAGIKSSDKILPEFQKIEVDQFIPFTPDQKNGMWVKDFKEPEYILWWDKKGNGTWGWYLHQNGSGETRLTTRLRSKYDFSFPWIIYYIFYDFGDIVMMSKCMLGIKERAELNFSRT